MHHTHEQDELRKVRKLIEGISFAMLTTEEDDGHLRSRPMATLQLDDQGALWFFTGAGSTKIDEIDHHQQVNLAYMDKDRDRYVSVSGRAELVRERHKIEELWNPIYKAWFPEGLRDPELALLKVTIERAEYWDPVSSKLIQAFGFVKAILKGEQARGGDHGVVEIGPAAP